MFGKIPTQQFLEVDQIKEGVIILKNRALRGVLMTSSINFVLKSAAEQKAVIYQFQNFLNSLDFPCQIVIQSRRLNLTGYLEKIKKLEEKQQNELLKAQTTNYHQFIKAIIKKGVIMTKKFFVVVPFALSETEGVSGKKSSKTAKPLTLSEEKFQRSRNQLWQRMEFVALGLRRCGLQAIPLTSVELMELFWSLHHPKEAEFGYYPDIPPELIQ